MSPVESIQDANRELARRINEEARSNPQSRYANKFVGIANGQVVVVADDLDTMVNRLRQIEPDASKTFCVEASRDYSVVQHISEAQPMRRFVRGLTLLALLALIPLGYYFYRASADADRLQALLAALDRNEPGWRLADWESRLPTISDEQNSALIINQVNLPARPRTLDWLVPLPPNRVLPTDKVAKLREYLESVRSNLVESRRVADLPEGRFPLAISQEINRITADLPHMRRACLFWSALRAAAFWEAEQGNLDQAVADVHAVVHAARTLRREPFPNSRFYWLLGSEIACDMMERIVAQGQPGATLLEQAQQLFNDEHVIEAWYDALVAERAALHEIYERIAEGKLDPSVIPRQTPFKPRWHDGLRDRFSGLTALPSHVWMLEHYTAKLATRDLPAKERRRRLDELREQAGKAPALAQDLTGGAEFWSHEIMLRVQAKVNATVAALAAERYRLQHRRWPKTLDELVPVYLEKVPLDPYDDQPLRYGWAKDGVVIYAVGPNGDYVGGAENTFGRNWEFRLWNIDRRRQ